MKLLQNENIYKNYSQSKEQATSILTLSSLPPLDTVLSSTSNDEDDLLGDFFKDIQETTEQNQEEEEATTTTIK